MYLLILNLVEIQKTSNKSIPKLVQLSEEKPNPNWVQGKKCFPKLREKYLSSANFPLGS